MATVKTTLNRVMRDLGYRRKYKDGLYGIGSSYSKADTRFYIYFNYLRMCLELTRTPDDKRIVVETFYADDIAEALPLVVRQMQSLAARTWQ